MALCEELNVAAVVARLAASTVVKKIIGQAYCGSFDPCCADNLPFSMYFIVSGNKMKYNEARTCGQVFQRA